MYEAFLNVIEKSVLFRGIEAENIVQMLKCFDPLVKRYKKNELLTIAGEPFTGIGVLLEGGAAVGKESLSGGRVVLKMIKPGELFGEMIAFSNQTVWPATVQAQDDSIALFIPREKIVSECGKLCSWHKLLIQNMLTILSNRALMLNRKLEYLSIKSMRGKLCAFLLDQYNESGRKTMELDMNRNELADFLNVSRPSMSRELRRMKDDGLIDYHLSSISIIDPIGLNREI